jgi:pyruvate ferredoxin oxidoreductase beta subunit/2-oxoisovalerate ferredoxin oxidoreductase beta subunit
MNTTETPLRYGSTDECINPPHGFCPGCGAALAIRYFLKAVGDKIILVMPPGCTAPSVIRALEHGGEPIDTMGSPFGNTAFIASGIKSGLTAKGDTETLVVGWAGDGATFDIGFGAVSAAAERNEDIIYGQPEELCITVANYQHDKSRRLP